MDECRDNHPPSVYTVGHSNHSVEHFLQLLRAHAIEVVIDTRSFPYSKYAPQFNVDVLRNVIKANEMRFGYLGRELGGRPAEEEFYDEAGHALYYKVAE